MGRIEGKVAVITGAASGMGRAAARLFVAEGARVVIADVDREGLAEVAAELGAAAAALPTDVSKTVEVQAMLALAMERFGGLDILFNNAGIEGGSRKIADYSEETWDRVINVNLKSVFLGMKYAVPIMAQRGGGSIVNTASVAGLVGYPGSSAYSAAKAGVVILTKMAAVEYARENIRVNAICPGVIHTAMVDRITGGGSDAIARLSRGQPLQTVGQPEDIAQMALFLASDESRFVTGTAIPVDGGYTAR